MLLAWTGLVRGTSEDVAMEKLIGCRQKCLKIYERCGTLSESKVVWIVCSVLFVVCDRQCKSVYHKTMSE